MTQPEARSVDLLLVTPDDGVPEDDGAEPTDADITHQAETDLADE